MKLLLLRIARFNRTPFWREAASIDSSVTLLIMPGVILFGLLAATICLVEYLTPPTFSVAVDVTAYEIGGAILGMLLVLRTNEGLSRWWEARKLWGGIVNQCRNF
jgi:putative membrane protein